MHCLTLTTILMLIILGPTSVCQQQETTRSIWNEVSKATIQDSGQRAVLPKTYRVFELQLEGLRESLAQAPMEFSSQAQSSETIVSLPFPDGSVKAFRVVESPTLAPDVQERHPELRTYYGRGVYDRFAACRLSLTPKGFHSVQFHSGDLPSGTYLYQLKAGTVLRTKAMSLVR